MAASASRSTASTSSAGSSTMRMPATADVEGRLELGQRSRDDGGDALARGVLAQDGELVAAEPAEGVVGTQRRGHPRGDLAQHRVAGVVAEAVVDALEAIEVEEDDREGSRVAPQPHEGAPDAIL